MKKIVTELRERGVVRAAGLYIAITWLLLQLGDVIFPAFDIPDSALTYILFGAIGGFPVAMVVSWFFDISSKGIRSEEDLREAGEQPRGSLLSIATIVLLGLALLVSLYGNYQQASDGTRQIAAPALTTLLVADFIDNTGEPELGLLVADLLALNVEAAAFISSHPRQAAAAERGVSPQRANTVASELGIELVLQGDISTDGDGFSLAVSAIDTELGEVRAETETAASGPADLLAAVARLAQQMREELGDKGPPPATTASNTPAPAAFTAATLDAAKFYFQARALEQQGQAELAAEYYQKATAADPELGLAWADWALLAAGLGKNLQSRELWGKALLLLDTVPARQRYRRLASYYSLAEPDTDRAIENYGLLLEQFPADSTAQAQLADVYFYDRQFNRALQHIAAASSAQAGNAELAYKHALYAMYAGNFTLAQQQAASNLQSQPDDSANYFPLAISALASGDFVAADDYYLKMAAVDPAAGSIASIGRADIALLRGDYGLAAELLSAGRLADLEAGDAEAAARKGVYLALAEHQRGNAARARVLLVEIIASTSETGTLLPAALLSIELGELAQARAIQAVLAASVAQETLAAADMLAAELALAAGEITEAVDALNSALRRRDSWLAHYELGRAYLKAGYFAEALGEFEQCEDRLGEVSAFFLDGIPSFHLAAALDYQFGFNKQKMGMGKAAIQNYQAYINLRVKTDSSPLTELARAELASLSR